MTRAGLPSKRELASFCALVRGQGARLYRDLPWRVTRDPWLVLLSEVMLQQTQVARVLRYWPRWLAAFPTPEALAGASTSDVLSFWQGLGYNRRALALKRTAEIIERDYAGVLPQTREGLLALPGVGPATAAGVCVFAFGLPQVYLETNVRAVFLHHFFSGREETADRDADRGTVPVAVKHGHRDCPSVRTRGREGISDRELIPLIEATCDREDPRGWYYALLDYGSYLKKTLPNPSRASAHHSRQSRFEGSLRQKRAWLLRELLAVGKAPTKELLASLNKAELKAGRLELSLEDLRAILETLAAEGFVVERSGDWGIP